MLEKGVFEGIHSQGVIYGWVEGSGDAKAQKTIYLYAGQRLLASVSAVHPRPDIESAGRSRQALGFGWIPPLKVLAQWRPGDKVHAYFDEQGTRELENSPACLDQAAIDALLGNARDLRYRRLAGRLDGISLDGKICGWAMDPEELDKPVPVYLYVGAHLLGKADADIFREDLRKTKIGNGKHGFFYQEWAWPPAIAVREGLALHAYFDRERRYELGTSPLILKQEDANRLDWYRTLQVDLRGRDLQRKHELLFTAEPIPYIAWVSMIKDEEDIIGLNLDWHYALGFRKFVLIDNGSTDGSRAAVEAFKQRFADAVVVIIEDPVVAHLQSEFTTGAFRLACAVWPELRWVFPVDADEFLCLERPLEAMLAGVPEAVDAVVFPKSFYMPVRGGAAVEGTPLFDWMGYRTPVNPVSAKVALRADPKYIISQGNHSISVAGGGAVAYLSGYGLGGHYREFRIRSAEHLRKKTINGGKAILAAEALGKQEVGGSHWMGWYQGYLQKGEGFFAGLFQSCFQAREGMVCDPMPYPPTHPRPG